MTFKLFIVGGLETHSTPSNGDCGKVGLIMVQCILKDELPVSIERGTSPGVRKGKKISL